MSKATQYFEHGSQEILKNECFRILNLNCLHFVDEESCFKNINGLLQATTALD